MFLTAFALSLALAQQPAPPAGPVAQPPVDAAAAAAAAEEAYLNEVICRREHVVGSNRPQRICQTRRQWNDLRERSLDEVNGGRRGVEDHLPTAGAGR